MKIIENSALVIEKSLCAWEDYWYLWETRYHLYENSDNAFNFPFEGSIRHWKEFRRDLLFGWFDSTSDDSNLVVGKYGVPRNMPHNSGFVQTLGNHIAIWSAKSRRVYTISNQVLDLLEITNFGNMTWEDVSFPFDAFFLKLERPIVSNRGFSNTSILVAKLQPSMGPPRLAMRLIADSVLNYEPITKIKKDRIKKQIQRRKFESVYDFINHHHDHCINRYIQGSGWFIPLEGESIQSTINLQLEDRAFCGKATDDDVRHTWVQIAKIVVGFCFYIQSLSSNSQEVSAWKKANRAPRKALPSEKKVVTDEARGCEVTSSYVLTRQERNFLDNERSKKTSLSTEKNPHWRAGFWRRAPGMGNDLNAPKIIRVRPTLVRRDRLKEGELPCGSETILRE